jgi:glycolate oxidase iron-sulfur subunit
MQHTIAIDQLGPNGPDMTRAIEACVHCGFCLPTCPTYVTLGEEMDSPRGRIFLMKSALEGQLTVNDTLPFIDRCLGCQACVTACPSGVHYGDLLTPYRDLAEKERHRPLAEQLSRTLVRETLPYPARFRMAAATGSLAQPLIPWMPRSMKAMLSLLPGQIPPAHPLPELYPAQGERRARVALLTGCVQSVLAPQINWATLRVLARNGVEVVIPPGQGCCGSILMHTGDLLPARSLARQNLKVFSLEVDAILTNAAGCGSGMKEYGLLLRGEPDESGGQAFANKVKDISEFLDELGIDPPTASPPLRVAYHDACHLAHAQKVSAAPRRLLQHIPNLTLLEIPEGELCCGSAGTYNIEQPELAEQIGQRKARNISSIDPEVVVTGNIGCLVQIGQHLDKLGRPLPLMHTIELLDRAYAGQ